MLMLRSILGHLRRLRHVATGQMAAEVLRLQPVPSCSTTVMPAHPFIRRIRPPRVELMHLAPKASDKAQIQSKEVRLPDAAPISLDDQDVHIALKMSEDLHLNEIECVRLLVSANQEGALRNAIASFVHVSPIMKETIWRYLEQYDLPVVVAPSAGNTGQTMETQVYDMRFELNEIEARREQYPSTVSFTNLLNTLMSDERDVSDRGHRFIGIFRFVYDHVFGPFPQRAYADPSEKWQLVVACLKHFQMMLSMYDVGEEDSDACTDQSQNLLVRQSSPIHMQLPIVEIMKKGDEDVVYVQDAYVHNTMTCFLSHSLARDKGFARGSGRRFFSSFVYDKALYRTLGSASIVLAFRWPRSDQFIEEENKNVLGSRFYFHGIFLPKDHPARIKKLKPGQYRYLLQGFDELFSLYEEEAIYYWSDFRKVRDAEATKQWIMGEWYKHGRLFGIPAAMYFYHGLAFAHSMVSGSGNCLGIPLDFGISQDEARKCVQESVQGTHLFGKSLGLAQRPEIQSMYDKKLLDKEKRVFPGLLTEVRPHVQLELVDGQARWKWAQVPLAVDPYRSGNLKRDDCQVRLP